MAAVHVILSEAKNLSRRRHPRGDSSLRSEWRMLPGWLFNLHHPRPDLI